MALVVVAIVIWWFENEKKRMPIGVITPDVKVVPPLDRPGDVIKGIAPGGQSGNDPPSDGKRMEADKVPTGEQKAVPLPDGGGKVTSGPQSGTTKGSEAGGSTTRSCPGKVKAVLGSLVDSQITRAGQATSRSFKLTLKGNREFFIEPESLPDAAKAKIKRIVTNGITQLESTAPGKLPCTLEHSFYWANEG